MSNLVSQQIEKEAKEVVEEVTTGFNAIGNTMAAGLEISCCSLSVIDAVKAVKNGKPLMAVANVASAMVCFAGYCFFANQAEKAMKKYAKIK